MTVNTAEGGAVSPAETETITPAGTATEAQQPSEKIANGEDPDEGIPTFTPSDAEEADKKAEQDKGKKRTTRIEQRIGRYKDDAREATSRAKAAEDRAAAAERKLALYERPLVTKQQRENLTYEQLEEVRVREAVRAEKALEARADIADARAEAQTGAQDAHYAQVVDKLQEAEAQFPGITKEIGTKIKDISPFTVEWMADSEVAPGIGLFLINDPEVADALFALSNQDRRNPHYNLKMAAKLLAEIEVAVKTAPARKATKAPDPGTTLRGGNPPAKRSLEEMSKGEFVGDYVTARRKELERGM